MRGGNGGGKVSSQRDGTSSNVVDKRFPTFLLSQEKLDQLLNEYEKEAGNIDAAIKKEMQKSQQARQNQR